MIPWYQLMKLYFTHKKLFLIRSGLGMKVEIEDWIDWIIINTVIVSKVEDVSSLR